LFAVVAVVTVPCVGKSVTQGEIIRHINWYRIKSEGDNMGDQF